MTEPFIHPTAIIDSKAQLDSSVKVGAYSIIGANVQIGADTEIGPHVVIEGHTTIGNNNQISNLLAWAHNRKTKNTVMSPPNLLLVTAIPFVNLPLSIQVQ